MTAHATVDTMVTSRRESRCHQQWAPGSASGGYAGCAVAVVRRIGGFGVLMLGVTKGGGASARWASQAPRCAIRGSFDAVFSSVQRTRADNLTGIEGVCDKKLAMSDL
jgi:hypothetical protein